MRTPRLLLPLTVILALASASPAAAADYTVDVIDFEFGPADPKIAVGDTVIWNFVNEGHTTTANRGQADRWNSGPGTSPVGTTYQKTFNTPGRFQYICVPHASFMKGTVTVGEDTVRKTAKRVTRVRRGGDVKVTYEINEPATVTYRLRGPSRRTLRLGREKKGKHTFRLKNLKAGRYQETLTMVDDFDKKATVRRSFRVP